MEANATLFIFGDQTTDIVNDLQLLLRNDNVVLSPFFERSFRALQYEISQLPPSQRVNLPQAETFGLLLAATEEKSIHHPALESALVTIYEIAFYIKLLAETGRTHPQPDSFYLGICTGSFAAAALSCAKTLFDIIEVGVSAIVAAFRVGRYVHQRAESLGSWNGDSWSAIVQNNQEANGRDLASRIEQFVNEKSLPPHLQLYISAVAPNSATISGPPPLLDELLASPDFQQTKHTKVSVYGPYHCPYVQPEGDIQQTLSTFLAGLECLDQPPHTPILSCSSADALKENTLGDLLRVFAIDAVSKPIRIDLIIEALSALPVTKFVAVNTKLAPKLTAALARKGKDAKVESAPPSAPSLGMDSDSKIAIVGFSGRFPEADGLSEFWDLLRDGLNVVKPVPADRFDGEAHFDPTGKRKNTSRVNHGCWIKEPGLFDTRFFQVSPREASQMDPAQRLALMTAYEAIEMAGFVADRTPSSKRHRVGVYYGTCSDDWREVNNAQDIDTYFIPGGIRAFIPGRINYFFKFAGPSISVDTACSSSLAAINIAITALLNGECDTAVAGGTNILTNPDNFAGLDRGHFLSTTGNCKTFDDAADGYCRADGVGTVLLKRLSDAIADKDPIFGVVLGAATNHSAESVSITRPLADAQEHIFKMLLNQTGVDPHDIGYVEMHGTGTQAGDSVEMKSVLNTFAYDYSRPSDKSLHLGSVKANIGHGESSSGVSALIKVLLMMQKSKIPPHCGITGSINRGFPKDLSKRGVHIALSEKDWLRPEDGKRRAFVNNFSAAGGNTALLLEDAPEQTHPPNGPEGPPSHHAITISARSIESLRLNLVALADFIKDSDSADLLAEISYTTTARRMHHRYRVAYVVNDIQHLKQRLSDTLAAAEKPLPIPARIPRVSFAFTGQGAQYTAMSQALYQRVESFRTDIHGCDEIATAQGFPSVLPLVDGRVPVDQLAPTVVQLGSCIIQIALARLWLNFGVEPDYVIGHSLGEYAALHLADVLSISDAIWLCGVRATLLEKQCTSGTHCMLAVKAPQQDLQQIIADTETEVACINGPEDTVVAGANDAMAKLSSKLTALKIRSTKLEIPFAFHSSQVEPLLEDFESACSRVRFNSPKRQFVSTLLRIVVRPGDEFPAEHYLTRQCREAVQFLGAVEAAQIDETIQSSDICIEIGGHPLLTRMMKSIVGSDMRFAPSLRRDEEVLKTLLGSMSALYLAGVVIDWNEYHRSFPASQVVVNLPHYSWDLQRCWIQYEPNWCLTKGDTDEPAKPVARTRSTRLSASVQDVVEQEVDEEHGYMLIESDLHEPEFAEATQQHVVGDLMLCSSSLYADIAYTMATHLAKIRYADGQILVPDVCNMAAEKTLVVKPTGPQLIRATMNINWDTGHGNMKILSADNTGDYSTIHATCDIVFQDPQVWIQDWSRSFYLIQRSIKRLHQGVNSASTNKFGRGMAYKLFSTLMNYGAAYQGMEEVVFDSQELEATAKIRLQPTKGKYMLNPCWIDSFGHLTGFVMNSNDSLDLTDNAYVNHGWAHMRCSEVFQPEAIYETYVRMQRVDPAKDDHFSGDVYVLKSGSIVAVYEKVHFSKLPRRILKLLQPSSGGPKNSTPALNTSKKPKAAGQPSNAKANAPPPPKPVKKQDSVASGSSDFEQALKVMAEEIGAELLTADDDTDFADFGLDSLMTLTILGIFRESLGLDVPASLFEDHPTKTALRSYFGGTPISSESSTITSALASPGSTAPTSIGSSPDDDLAHDNGNVEALLQILAEETGVDHDELYKAEDFADVGLDSLLTLTVSSRALEELGLDLPHDFFSQHKSVAEVTSALGKPSGGAAEKSPSPPKKESPPIPSDVRATSVMLQGGNNKKKTLFLLPDGSGSSTSYAAMPTISPDLCVVGLNCPYMKNAQDMNCSILDLVSLYVAEIRRRQPTGPFRLAGWSAGGILAYEAAQYLVNDNEVVEQLILIDSPNPIGIEKLPPRFYELLSQAGVFGGDEGSKAPAWLVKHFLATVDVLDGWKPVPFRGKAPKTSIIWAKQGVFPQQKLQQGDTREMRWLLENRKDKQLGTNGWDSLLGKNITQVACMDEAHHFNMVKMPFAATLATTIRKLLI